MPDQFVAGSVAKLVIEVFQAVQVQHQDGQGAAVALRARNFLCQTLFSRSSVMKTRKWVKHGKLINLFRAYFHLA